MAIQNIGTTISGIASDTKPTLTANEKGVIFVETDTNKIYQWDTDSWNQIDAGAALTGSTNNTVVTVTGADAMQGEANLTFDGSTLAVTGEVSATTLDIGGTNITSTAAELNLLDALDRGSILYGNASGATTVLGQGGANTVLTSDGTDIAWQAAAGGGALEFVSKTTLSSSAASISFTGFTADSMYKMIGKKVIMASNGMLRFRPYLNGSSSLTTGQCDYVLDRPYGNTMGNDANHFELYTYGYEDDYFEFEVDFSTSLIGWFRGAAHPNGNTANPNGYVHIFGQLHPATFASSRFSGFNIVNDGGDNFLSGTEIILYKWKES